MRFASTLARINGLSGELRAARYFSFARLSGLDFLSDFFPRLAPGATLFCPLRGLDFLSDFFPRLAPGATLFCPLRGLGHDQSSRRWPVGRFEIYFPGGLNPKTFSSVYVRAKAHTLQTYPPPRDCDLCIFAGPGFHRQPHVPDSPRNGEARSGQAFDSLRCATVAQDDTFFDANSER